MVTLSKPTEGSTGWATAVNQNWTSLEGQVIAMQGRLTLSSGNPAYNPQPKTPSSTSTAADTVDFASAHGWTTGTMVTPSATGGGLTAGTTYYINAVDSDTVSFHTSLANALAGTPKVDLTGSITAEIRPLGVSNTTLYLSRYVGDAVDVNGETALLGSSGISLTTTDNLITSTGADAGAAMAASTLYYIYLSNSSASSFAGDLRASTTAPSLYNGVKYLGTSGNAANWRFVGWVRTNSSTQFVDSATQRLVINYYNRRQLSLESTPGYLNNNSISSFDVTSTTYTPANGGTGSKLEFVSNGVDHIVYVVYANIETRTAGQAAYLGVGEDSTSSAAVATRSSLTDITSVTVGRSISPSEGYHYLELLVAVSGGTGRYYSDIYRLGSGSDPRALVFSVNIFG